MTNNHPLQPEKVTRAVGGLYIFLAIQYLTFNSPPPKTPPIKKLSALIILYLHIVFGGHPLD